MNEKRGFHVTVVENETGETVSDFDTRAIVYVMLDEIDEEKVRKKHGSDMSCGVRTCQYIDRIRPNEMLGVTNGLQSLLQDITEEHPELKLLAQLCDQRTIETIDLDEEED